MVLFIEIIGRCIMARNIDLSKWTWIGVQDGDSVYAKVDSRRKTVPMRTLAGEAWDMPRNAYAILMKSLGQPCLACKEGRLDYIVKATGEEMVLQCSVCARETMFLKGMPYLCVDWEDEFTKLLGNLGHRV